VRQKYIPTKAVIPQKGLLDITNFFCSIQKRCLHFALINAKMAKTEIQNTFFAD